MEKTAAATQYEAPQIEDHGSLTQLTASIGPFRKFDNLQPRGTHTGRRNRDPDEPLTTLTSGPNRPARQVRRAERSRTTISLGWTIVRRGRQRIDEAGRTKGLITVEPGPAMSLRDAVESRIRRP